MNKISIKDLHANCIYSSIAHAVYVLEHPIFASEQSWDGSNYCFQYGSARGTIAFDREHRMAAGAMRQENSIRIRLYPDQMKASDLFRNAPERIQKLAASETLMYLYDSIGDFTGPVATAGFWMVNEECTLCEEERSFLQEGGEFAEVLFQNLSDIKEYWRVQYSLSDVQMKLVNQIFTAYEKQENVIRLDRPYKAILKKSGYSEMLQSLEEIGLTIQGKTGLFRK